jgi:hypothetical protein
VRIVRDLRLDLFRGLALLSIFLDHIPSNVVSWITVRNYRFSDATEIFIFISGYANAYVYGAVIRRRGLIDAAAWILNRAWQIYLAQIFLALAALVVRFVPRDWRMLASPVLRPVIRVGQHSLEIFGLGVVLAFAGHFATVDVATGIAMQVLVSALGIAAMISVALLISWYDSIGVPFEIVAEDPDLPRAAGT